MEETVRELIKQHKPAQELSTPDDFTSPEVLYQELLRFIRIYHPSDDFSLIEKAYHVADEAHQGQKRKSGEPYIIHPLCVAIILAELEMDKETIVAGLLHDVVEDTAMTKEDVAREFSDEVALLVDGVTKLTQLNLSQDKIEIQAENLRKMFLAMAKDIRVIIIKLADRLHNLRTLQYQSPAKQIEKARETMDIYAPIAHRLGISKIKIELDDLCMQYLYPEVYKDLQQKIDERLAEREEFISHMVEEVSRHIREAGIQAEIDGRVKHIFSIYKKMKTQNKTLDQIYDVFALRVKVDTVRDCYAALGIIHEKYKPIPGRFKDYIAMPKANMYQSLHTTLIGHEGKPFEIQIRTILQHTWAEIEHDLGYKTEFSIPRNVRREFSRVAGLLEIADESFLRIRNSIHQYETEVREKIAVDQADDMPLDLVSLKAYLELSQSMNRLLADIAAINNSKIIESDPEPYLQDLAFFNIHTLGELRTFVRENRDDALYFAKQALTGIALDELSSIVGLYYICRAKLVRGDYNLRQLIVFFMLGDSTPKRAEQHANHILRLREKEQA